MSSLDAQQTEQVRIKVLYSEVDIPFNGYLEALNRVTKLTKSILKGGLQSYETQENVQFGKEHLKNLEQNLSLKYLQLQSSIDVKKSAQENWEQSNNETITTMEEKVPEMIERLRDANSRLEERIERVRGLYDSVRKVNAETENLLEGNTSLTTTRSEWERELGPTLTDKLIRQGYMRNAESFDGEERYRVYDNFTKGPKELRHINQSIKADISRLTDELVTYKSRWLEDANVFSRITSVLREELAKRNMDVDIDMDEREEEEDEEEEEEEEEVEEEEEEEEEDAEEVMGDSEEEEEMADEEDAERDEYDDEGQDQVMVEPEEEIGNGGSQDEGKRPYQEDAGVHEPGEINEPAVEETKTEPNQTQETGTRSSSTPP